MRESRRGTTALALSTTELWVHIVLKHHLVRIFSPSGSCSMMPLELQGITPRRIREPKRLRWWSTSKSLPLPRLYHLSQSRGYPTKHAVAPRLLAYPASGG